MKNKVNYDKIASKYDLCYHGNSHQGVHNALRTLLSQEKLHKVVEVGCGTCHWLKALCSFKDIDFWGIDASLEMLKCAQQPGGISLCQGQAEHLPISNNSIDFIFCVNALHQFSSKVAFVKEGYRILSKGGRFAIIGMDPRDQRNNWYIYKFFEGTYERDLDRFPSSSQVKDWLLDIGFKEIKTRDVEFIHDPKLGRAVLDDPFLEKNACSQLALLSQAEYKQGMEQIKHSLTNDQSRQNVYENDIVLTMIVGEKPNKP